MIILGERTILTKATPKSNSLRTTVPIFIVKQFGLNDGDMLDWELRVVGGELSIIVKPVKKGGTER
ncbi:AbrB/MazE/SpoVT family DNA-binding domain-containing protein [Thermococcus sp.]